MNTPQQAQIQVNSFMDDLEAIQGSPKSLIPNGQYRSLSPIMQLYAKKLWVGGHVANPDQILEEVKALHPSVEASELRRYIESNLPRWADERKHALEVTYQQMLNDRQAITEHVDYTYDNLFDKIRGLTEKTINSLQHEDALAPRTLKQLASTAKELHECQRLTRNLAKGTVSHEHRHQIDHNGETREFTKQLEELNGILKQAKVKDIIDVDVVLEPETKESTNAHNLKIIDAVVDDNPDELEDFIPEEQGRAG